MSASLKSSGIFVKKSGQRSILRSNVTLKQLMLETSAIPHFHVILTGRSIFKIILNIRSHIQGQKVKFKVI